MFHLQTVAERNQESIILARGSTYLHHAFYVWIVGCDGIGVPDIDVIACSLKILWKMVFTYLHEKQ
jgi:hypothetical protein